MYFCIEYFYDSMFSLPASIPKSHEKKKNKGERERKNDLNGIKHRCRPRDPFTARARASPNQLLPFCLLVVQFEFAHSSVGGERNKNLHRDGGSEEIFSSFFYEKC